MKHFILLATLALSTQFAQAQSILQTTAPSPSHVLAIYGLETPMVINTTYFPIAMSKSSCEAQAEAEGVRLVQALSVMGMPTGRGSSPVEVNTIRSDAGVNLLRTDGRVVALLRCIPIAGAN